MITRITKENADKYSVLFNDALKALKDNKIIDSVTNVEETKVREDKFIPGVHYIKNGDVWELTSQDAKYDPFATYGIEVSAITTLEEYFSYIADLCGISKKFTILPLDEELFEINANTRTIKIPNNLPAKKQANYYF